MLPLRFARRLMEQHRRRQRLHAVALDNEDAAVTALLIAADAEVNAKTEEGASPLQFALGNPNPQVAETLVKAGARR